MWLLFIRTCSRPGIPTWDARVPSRAISTGHSQHRRIAFAAYRDEFLRQFVPRYVQNTVIRRDLQIPTVKEEIRRYSSQYSARLSAHPNDLTVNLTELPDNKTPAKWSAYQIPSVIVVFVVLVYKVVEWTPLQTHYFSDNLVAPGIEPGPLNLWPGTLPTNPQRRPH
jgi:hypothetical protein